MTGPVVTEDARVSARAWIEAYGIRTAPYTRGGGDHPMMDTLPGAFQAFAEARATALVGQVAELQATVDILRGQNFRMECFVGFVRVWTHRDTPSNAVNPISDAMRVSAIKNHPVVNPTSEVLDAALKPSDLGAAVDRDAVLEEAAKVVTDQANEDRQLLRDGLVDHEPAGAAILTSVNIAKLIRALKSTNRSPDDDR